MVDEEMSLSSIMTLLEEERSVIFNLIPQTETVNLRLVCKTWNQEIQNNYEYDIEKLDEDSSNFKSILNLRIRKLKIQKLEITPVLNFDGTSIFKHPNTIQKLEIRENALIPQLNLQMLLGLLSNNLRILGLNLATKICNYQFPSDLCFNFKNLKYLCLNGVENGSEKCEDTPSSIFLVVENSFYPNLRILSVNLLDLAMTPEANFRIVGNLLRLISKQGKYFEHLIIDITSESELIEFPVSLQEEKLLCIKQIQTLKKVSLDLSQFWNEFLCIQKQLELLDIGSISPTYPVSVSLVGQISFNNSATLKKIKIADLHLSPNDPPFDLSVFENCQGLNELKLSPSYDPITVRENPEEPDVVNLHCLPDNLITLELNYLKVLSEEVLIAFRSNDTTGAKGFKKLQELTLIDCGKQGQVGINAVVLYKIMMTARPNLTNVDFLGGVHIGGAAMKTVLHQLQLSDETDFTDFRLKKEPGELCWKCYH